MKSTRKISVIMPVYNEEKTVKQILDSVLKQDCVSRVIVIDDSRDRSPEIVRKSMAKDSRILLIHNKIPMGKGNALIMGIKKVRDGLILVQDADAEYFPEDYPSLLSKAGAKNAVFGSRLLSRNANNQYKLAKLANIVMSATFSFFFGQRITDIYTCYKLFYRNMVNPSKLKQRDFLIETEIAAQIIRNGYEIKEVPIRYRGRTYEEGKKIGAMDGIRGLFYIIKEGISYSFGR